MLEWFLVIVIVVLMGIFMRLNTIAETLADMRAEMYRNGKDAEDEEDIYDYWLRTRTPDPEPTPDRSETAAERE